jgi:thiol-disulfide isomerase/thioredoxin
MTNLHLALPLLLPLVALPLVVDEPRAPAAALQEAGTQRAALEQALELFRAARSEAEAAGDKNFRRTAAAKLDELLEGVAVEHLALADLLAMQREQIPFEATKAAARLDAAAATRATQPDAAGLDAALVRLHLVPREQRRSTVRADVLARTERLTVALGHPLLGDALARGEATNVFEGVGLLTPETLREQHPVFVRLLARVPDTVGFDGLRHVYAFFAAVPAIATEAEFAAQEAQRARFAGLLAAHLAGATLTEKEASSAKRMHANLEGAYFKRQLVGGPAPDLDFTFAHHRGDAAFAIDSLADLRGKVVVLDFWATWCGPCIASFPNVRELVSHYEGYDVVVLGVTSLQGTHYGAAGQVDTKGDPAKEYELMKEFVVEKDMTWPVAFSTADVFDPNYGVNGIPHVCIIDPAGVLRVRGLHPAMDSAKEHETIDALLAEFGLRVPPAKASDGERAGG